MCTRAHKAGDRNQTKPRAEILLRPFFVTELFKLLEQSFQLFLGPVTPLKML